MKKIANNESVIIIDKFLKALEISIRNGKEIIIENIELEIDDKIYEKANCAYFQNEDASEAILYEILMQRFFYIKTENINNSEKLVPELYLLDSCVKNIIPKKIQEKFLSVVQNRNSEHLVIEDFFTKFKVRRLS